MSQATETVRKAEARKASTSRRIAGIVGGLAFVVGIILAIVGGAAARDNGGIVLALVIVGIIVALLNITGREVVPVLVAAVALIVAGSLDAFAPLDNLVDGFGRVLDGIVAYFATFMVPVAVITAVRAVIALARPG